MSLTKSCGPCGCRIISTINPNLELCLPDKTFETTMVQVSPNGQKCVDGTVGSCSGVEWCLSVDIPFQICNRATNTPLPTPVEVDGCDISPFSGCDLFVGFDNFNETDGTLFCGTTISLETVKIKNNGKSCVFSFESCFTLTGVGIEAPVRGFALFGCGDAVCDEYYSNIYVPEIVDEAENNQKYPYYDRQAFISVTGYLGAGYITGIAPIG